MFVLFADKGKAHTLQPSCKRFQLSKVVRLKVKRYFCRPNNHTLYLYMFTIIKKLEVSAAHKLNLPYESKCTTLHGHNWMITIYCRANELNDEGMVVDFSHIKSLVTDKLDHHILNDVIPGNPTSENIARWICSQVPNCFKVEVQETEGSTVIYEKD